MKKLNYKESLKEIQSYLNNDLSVKERMELVNKLLDNGVKVEFDYASYEFVFTYTEDEYQDINIESIFEYIDSPVFKKQNGDKKKANPRYEDTYLAKGLSNISDYVLDKWQEWDGRNESLDDYEVWSKYEVERGRKDRENKRVIGFNADVIDDFLENGLSDTVKQGLEVHFDKVDDYLSKSQKSFKLSESEKRQQRKQEVLDNLEEYPDLKVSYDAWKQLGLKYGFDEEYLKKERDALKQYWITEFENENHSVSPKKRLYDLRKQYNDMGYTLHKILKELQKKIKINKSKQISPMQDTDNEIYDLFDLENPEHIAALLKIDYDKKDKEYFPLYYLLHEDYKEKLDSGLYYIFESFHEALRLTDLNNMEKDIVNLLIGANVEYSIYNNQACTNNPYKLIVKYINEKYGLNKSKANIIHIIENKIAKLIADTYYNLKIGTHSLKCTKCEKEKLATLNNFGHDPRNKTGFKSTCKKCLAEIEREKINKV